MADSYTANLNLTLPEVGASRDTWGGKVNADMSAIDALFNAAGNGTSVGLNVGSGKTLSVAGTLNVSGTATLPAAATAGGATVATTSGTQTLTNKTLTNPAINGFTGDTSVVNIGSGQIYKDTSGNVGLGTTSPSRQISISNSTQSNIQLTTSAAGATITDGFQLQFTDSGAYVWNYEATPTFFGTSNSERMRIESTGGVCIGATSSGGYKLRVDGTTGAYVTTVNNTAIYGYSSGGGIGVQGQSVNSYGINGSSTNTYGGYFSSTNNHGMYAQGLYYGIYGATTASSYGGVIGFSQNGSYYGICGYSNYFSFYGNGNASITNGTWGTSDIRFKEVVDENPFAVGGPYDRSAVDIVMSIPVRAYKLKGPLAETSINGVDQFGWIAQEVEAVLPLAVTETPIPPNDIKTRAWIAEVAVPEKDSDAEKALIEREDLRYKSLNKDYLIAALWGAVQELKQQNDALVARVSALEAK